MKRRLFSILLAVALMVAFTVTAFAYGYTYYQTYNNAEVELNAQCGGNACAASTNTMSTDFRVKTDVKVYELTDPSAPNSVTYYTVLGNECYITSKVEVDGIALIDRIVPYHYAGGHLIYSQVVYPSE